VPCDISNFTTKVIREIIGTLKRVFVSLEWEGFV
jgi:hypothetical protein